MMEFIGMLIIGMIIIVIMYFVLYHWGKKLKRNNLFRLSRIFALTCIILGNNASAMQITMTIINNGGYELNNFNFVGNPIQLDNALSICSLNKLSIGESYTCNMEIDTTGLSGNIEFIVDASADYLNGNVQKSKSGTKSFGTYHFEYPEYYKDGYYLVPCSFVRPDNLEYCYKCSDISYPKGTCKGYTGASTLYDVNEGYIEDFTYDSDFPIYGSWEIRNFNDFSEKCFVGDCNRANYRRVLCIDENNNVEMQSFPCNMWEYPVTFSESEADFLCTNNELYYTFYDEIKPTKQCDKPTTFEFYYNYNEWDGYEGYSDDWQERWSANFEKVRQKFAEYNIFLTANYHEVKIDDDSNLPATLTWGESPSSKVGSTTKYVNIMAGKERPNNYGVDCPIPQNGSYNPCSAFSGSSIRIPDYYDYSSGDGYETLIHELGHAFGCGHTGRVVSLGGHLYMGDIMSYGTTSDEFLYECRIYIWLLGQNG